MLVARRFAFFNFNLKAKALILAALRLRWRRLYCLPPGIATCYPRSVNRNIFYIIGVIVVIVIVLKVLGVF
jgi:hypothetical protein